MRWLFFLIFINSLSAQKEDHQWIFNGHQYDDVSDEPRAGASVIDFNTLPPRAYRNEAITLDFQETNSFYADENGQLLLYTNGQAVYGANHKAITNGDTINYGRIWDIWTWKNEHDEVSSVGFRIEQGISIIPIDLDATNFMVLYKNADNGSVVNDPLDLWMARIVKTSSEDFIVTQKDSVLLTNIFLSGDVHACRHGNGRDWWMLQFSDNTVYAFLIDDQGIQLDHEQILPQALRPGFSFSNYSSDGSKFALSVETENDTNDGIDLLVADFDRCSGELTNPIIFKQSSDDTAFGGGVEFSPDGKLLYTTTALNIFQFDLQADDILASKISVGEYDYSSICELTGFELFFGRSSLAPDNKIYVGTNSQCFNLSVINHPNQRGRECEFQHNVVKKPTFTRNEPPNTNTWRLGPLDGSSCDTLGLDNNPVSRFWYEQDSSDFLTVQFWDVSYFLPESWSWTFVDGNNSSEQEPMHSYSEKGIYEACLTVSNENSSHTSCQELNFGISSTSEDLFSPDISIYPNPTDDFVRITFHDYLPQSASISYYLSLIHI